jgi:hypothetical protein
VSRLADVRSDSPLSAQATTPERAYLPLSVLFLSTACGVLVVSLAYTAGRHGQSNSSVAGYGYWAGQALILVPAAIRLLSRKGATDAGAAAAIVAMSVAQYLCKLIYSPLLFTYSDELDHWLTAENMMRTGKLFSPNYALPVSPQYPGLEEAATALAQISGLSLFTAGAIVAGTAHLLFVVCLYLLAKGIGRSHRLAGIAVLVYSTNPGLAYFDSLFSYQTLAIAFMGVALVTAWRLTDAKIAVDRLRWAAVAMICIAATVVTHHVTSYILTLTLVLVAFTGLLAKDRRATVRAGALALWGVIAIVVWVAFFSPHTVTYLTQPLDVIVRGFRALLSGSSPPGGTAAATPIKPAFSHQLIQYATVLILSGLVPVGLWQIRRRFRGQAWLLALGLGSLSWYAILVLRFAAANGSELAGRAATFVYIPSAFIAALGISWFLSHVRVLPATAFVGASVLGVLLMSVNGLINSLPPSWERLPGPHQVAGVERSVGPQEVAVGDWLLTALGSGKRVAADYGNTPVVGSYGYQIPILGDGFLYLAPTYTAAVEREVYQQEIHYVVADIRLTQQLPASGQYFPPDSKAGTYTHPLPLVDMTKFNHISWVARIFDSGDIVIYDMYGDH